MSGCGQRGSGHNVNLILITIDTLRAEAFATDQFIGDLVAQLEKLELADDTIIAVVSDHGEYLQEHGLTNRHGLYDEVLHVPMFIHWRGLSKTERRHGTVSTIDQAPALLDMRGVAKMSSAQGHRLGKRASGGAGTRPWCLPNGVTFACLASTNHGPVIFWSARRTTRCPGDGFAAGRASAERFAWRIGRDRRHPDRQ